VEYNSYALTTTGGISIGTGAYIAGPLTVTGDISFSRGRRSINIGDGAGANKVNIANAQTDGS